MGGWVFFFPEERKTTSMSVMITPNRSQTMEIKTQSIEEMIEITVGLAGHGQKFTAVKSGGEWVITLVN
jgi:hypothetical protein